MRISTALLFGQGVKAIQEQQAALARTQQQVATGKRILSPADDPAAAKRLMDLDQSLALTRQYTRNADTATNRLSLEDSALEGATNLLQRVRELAIQSNNAVLTDADRGALAEELAGRLGELLGLANTRDGNNEYLFAGVSTQTRPFSRAAGNTFSYNGDQGARELQIAPGYHVRVGDSGADVFMAIASGNGVYATGDDPGNGGSGRLDPGSVTDLAAWIPDDYTIDFVTPGAYEVRDGAGALVVFGTYQSGDAIAFNGIEVSIEGAPAAGDRFTVSPSTARSVFETVQSVVDTLRTPVITEADDARLGNALGRALLDIDQSLANVDTVRARIGARLNAIESEKNVNAGFEVHLQEVHSQIQDLDFAEAISRLTQQSTALEAAQASFARIQGLSLFNYLR
jgi:flagellar hook-associated protein 3 FlgL